MTKETRNICDGIVLLYVETQISNAFSAAVQVLDITRKLFYCNEEEWKEALEYIHSKIKQKTEVES